ncbi:hypothetical protein A4X20_06100 [Mycolicibacterium iranicum]|uniref:Uncharacterized protein n=1 Tax=Mycolicibacterium iranicum TaxID=912594 RepID=A0A178LSD1_MYCIR|nr:hypothetical protein A4X20_06100 [Mycolicibacterium iranicum]
MIATDVIDVRDRPHKPFEKGGALLDSWNDDFDIINQDIAPSFGRIKSGDYVFYECSNDILNDVVCFAPEQD